MLSPAELMRTEKPPLAPWLLTSIGALMTFYGSRSRDYWKEGGQAERYFSSSRDSLDNTDSSRFTGAALRGIIHATDLFGGDLCRAEAALEDVMAIERGRGDVLGVVWTLNSLAHIRVRRGHYREAFAQFEELAAGYRKAGFDREVAESELQLLILAIAVGWHEEADRRMVRFLAHQRDLAYRLLIHLAVGFYACSAAARGMAREAALIVGANSAHCAASQLADSLHWCEVGDFELAAQSCDGDWEWYGVESYPVHDTFVRVMRDLGEEEYRRLRRQGSRMILEEAVGMILHVNDPAVEAQLLASD